MTLEALQHLIRSAKALAEDLIRALHQSGRLDASLVKERVALINTDERGIARASRNHREVFGS